MSNTSETINRRHLLVNTAKGLSIAAVAPAAKAGSSQFQAARHCENTGWSAGGTRSMFAPFPPRRDPFRSGLGQTCRMQNETIVGPCFFDDSITEYDISDGEPGIPMAFVLKIVDDRCEPVCGAKVEVWWCNHEGDYSADYHGASNGSSLIDDYRPVPKGELPKFYPEECVVNESNRDRAAESKWFRGIQTSDGRGNVYYKACFPGWYASRATHIHIRVVLNGQQSLVTQLGFDEDMSKEISLNHIDYTGVEPDTPNDVDIVFAGLEDDEYQAAIRRQFDGSMLVYKALQLPSE